jgi:hypothetical protein
MAANRKSKTGRPPGRPRKFVAGRIHATVRIAPQRYADIQATAGAAARSISEEVEARLERLATVDDVLAAMGTSLGEIRQGTIEAELHRLGYVPFYDADGHKVLLPPNHPLNPGRSGFVAFEQGEREAYAAAREQSGIGDAEVEARNQAKLAEADQRPKFDMEAALRRLNAVERMASESKKDDAA